MKRFHIIDDGAAIVRSRGVYRQVKIYHRDGKVYAAHGTGFVKLFRGGGTGTKDLSWLEIDGGVGQCVEETKTLDVVWVAPVETKLEAAE